MTMRPVVSVKVDVDDLPCLIAVVDKNLEGMSRPIPSGTTVVEVHRLRLPTDIKLHYASMDWMRLEDVLSLPIPLTKFFPSAEVVIQPDYPYNYANQLPFLVDILNSTESHKRMSRVERVSIGLGKPGTIKGDIEQRYRLPSPKFLEKLANLARRSPSKLRNARTCGLLDRLKSAKEQFDNYLERLSESGRKIAEDNMLCFEDL